MHPYNFVSKRGKLNRSMIFYMDNLISMFKRSSIKFLTIRETGEIMRNILRERLDDCNAKGLSSNTQANILFSK